MSADPIILDTNPPMVATKPSQQLWPRDDAKVVRRALTILNARHVQVVMVCEPCSAKEQRMVSLQPTQHPVTGELELVCLCAYRVMEGTT